MRVAFLLGRNSESLVNSMSRRNDDIEFFIYDSLGSMVNESLLRHIFYDRIVFSESIFVDRTRDLSILNEYIVENSESTSVVMIVKSCTSEAIEEFNSIFNSPLYTVAIIGKATLLMLCDIIEKDIVEIRLKYYTTILEQGGLNNQPNKKEFKSSFFGFGKGKKQDQEQQPQIKEPVNSGKNVGLSAENNYQSGVSVNSDYCVRNASNGSASVNMSKEDGSIISNNSGNGGSVIGSPIINNENDQFSDEDDFLGLGSFGKSHSDTGFLDEQDIPEEEGTENDEVHNQKFENVGSSNKDKNQKPENDTSPNESNNQKDDGLVLDIGGFTKVILMTGERGVGVTSTVVDLAISLYEKGESVLLVDADHKRNGLLSFIDARDFYDKGNEDGIDTFNPYIDEEADIASNGYGSPLSKSALMTFINSGDIRDNYDRIIIDCPLDCLNSISERMIRGNTVVVLTKGTLVSMIATSIGLTDRSVVESSLERYIMNNCTVGISNYSDTFYDDLNYVRDTVMFPNGCWLDNIR